MKAIIVYRELENVTLTRLCRYADEEIQNDNISYDDLINEIFENQGSAPFPASKKLVVDRDNFFGVYAT